MKNIVERARGIVSSWDGYVSQSHDEIHLAKALLDAVDVIKFYSAGHVVVYDLKDFISQEPPRERTDDFKTDDGEKARAFLSKVGEME